MKKFILIFCLIVLSTAMFADFNWLQLNLYEGVGVANPFGDTYNMTYFEIEGGGKTGVLDFYYFVDVEHIFGILDDVKEGTPPGSYFMKIAPRLSLTKMMKKDKCFGPVKESYIAMRYKGFSGGEDYAIGLGTDLNIPYFDMFGFNIYKVMIMTEEENDGSIDRKLEDGGIVFAINWYTKVKEFNEKWNLTYQGWSDLGIANSYREDNSGVATEFQMFNGFFWNYEKYSISTSVKLHNNFLYFDTENHDAISFFFGLHRRF